MRLELCDRESQRQGALQRRWLGAPPRSAAPSAPDLNAGLSIPVCGLSVGAYEFTACDQGADCAAALEGSPLSPREMTGPFRGDPDSSAAAGVKVTLTTRRSGAGAGGGAAERLEASRRRR